MNGKTVPTGAADTMISDSCRGCTKEKEVEVEDPQSAGRRLEAVRPGPEHL